MRKKNHADEIKRFYSIFFFINCSCVMLTIYFSYQNTQVGASVFDVRSKMGDLDEPADVIKEFRLDQYLIPQVFDCVPMRASVIACMRLRAYVACVIACIAKAHVERCVCAYEPHAQRTEIMGTT